jgi:hypothetical protein
LIPASMASITSLSPASRSLACAKLLLERHNSL